MADKLSTQSYKGARDFFPEDMAIRNYIFNNWKKVCRSYGYEEYDGPFLESFDIYAAKSGDELVNEQLYSFEDRGGRKVAIRPEMTPTLARMVASKYKSLPRPIRWFSIPNLWRYEKPQRGRLREHYQLNVDIFGIDGVEADFEIISIINDLVKIFGATGKMYKIKIGNRRLINDVYKKLGISDKETDKLNRIIDKKNKISQEEFDELLTEWIKLDQKQVKELLDFMENPNPTIEAISDSSRGAKEVNDLLVLCDKAGIAEIVQYDPTIVRGLDYYTGNVFELYDMNPENQRAMCGGGRYDDLVEMFVGEKLSGVGFGMGDVTFLNFLENWKLLPEQFEKPEYFVTLWPSEDPEFMEKSVSIAKKLREKGKTVVSWLENGIRLDKQLKSADKLGAEKAIIIGENELKNGEVSVKDLKTKEQKTLKEEGLLQ